MFERLTLNLKQVILDAVRAATTAGADKVGPEHLMTALATSGGVGSRVLASYGVTTELLRASLAGPNRRAGLTDDEVTALRAVGIDAELVFQHVEEAFGPDALAEPSPPPRRRGRLGGPFDRDGRKVLELSLREAIALGQKRRIGTEHLLLALLRHGLREPMATVLTDHSVSYEDAKKRTLAESRKAA
jgi:ATP-dependent Clp protease ATP-binding subunit ClpA